jgi:hypothetical protein
LNVMTLNWCCSVNCEAELLPHILFDKRDLKSAPAGTLLREQKRIPGQSSVRKLSRVREEEALALLSALVFRPSGTHSSNFILFRTHILDFLTETVAGIQEAKMASTL